MEVGVVGAAMCDRHYELTNLPEPDGGAFARDASTAFGGIGGNVAAALSNLGREVGLVTRLGDDGDADAVERDLRERGVDARRVRRGPGESTYSLILRDPEGRRMIVTGGDSFRALRLDGDDVEYLAGADAVFVTAYTPDAAARRLLDAARGGRLGRLAFDLSGPVEELRDRGTEPGTIDALLPHCDCFVAGEVALASYLPDADDPAAALRDRGCRRGALTRGADGATLFEGDRTVRVPAFGVDVVDTTGAGDAFNAGLVHAWLLAGRDVRGAGRFAAACAALDCTAEGARGGLPTAGEVREFLAGR